MLNDKILVKTLSFISLSIYKLKLRFQILILTTQTKEQTVNDKYYVYFLIQPKLIKLKGTFINLVLRASKGLNPSLLIENDNVTTVYI